LTLNFPNISFSASKFAFFNEKFLRRRFSDSPKFRGRGVPPATTPLIALKYEAGPLPFVVSGAPADTHLSYAVSGNQYM